MLGRSRGLVPIALFITALPAAACGGSKVVITTTVTVPSGTSTKAASPTAGLDHPSVIGPAVVLSDDYGLPNTTGYQTVVVFRVRNPLKTPIYEVPYRVTVLDKSGETLMVTTGSDTFDIDANSTRPVVAFIEDIEGRPPARARVALYEGQTETANAPPVIPQRSWLASNKQVDCSGVGISCKATMDLQWAGEAPQSLQQILVLIHRDSLLGPIVGAGAAPQFVDDQVPTGPLHPGQIVPIAVSVTGMPDNLPKALRAEIYVEALQNRSPATTCPPGEVPVGETGACAPEGE